MWILVKKNSKHFILYTLPMMCFLFYFWFGTGHGEDGYFVFMQLLWTLVIINGAISINEKDEEKNNGYLILKTLPVTDKEIVHSKFFVSAIGVAALTVYNMAISFFIIKSPEISKIIYPLLLLWGIFSLLLSAMIYIGIFKHGYTKNAKYAVLMLPIVVIFMIFNHFISDMLSTFFDIIISFINTGFWLFLIPLGLFVYIKLMHKAIRVKENTEVI